MNKKNLLLMSFSLLTTTPSRSIHMPSESNTRKIMLGFLFSVALYYEALAKPTDTLIELSPDSSCLDQLIHYLRYELNLGQQEKKTGYKIEFNGTTGNLKETKIKATGLGKLYVAIKNCARLLSLPAALIGISRSLEAYDLKPTACNYVMPAPKTR